MMLFIAPLRVKKKIRIKEGKVTLEEVKEEKEETTTPVSENEKEQENKNA